MKEVLAFQILNKKIILNIIYYWEIYNNPNEYQKRQNLNLAISTTKILDLKYGGITSEIIIEQSNCPLIALKYLFIKGIIIKWN